ncbi:hypothetical protein Tco_0623883 [Tanacetum coccineum]|uniref:Reverse transcriptase Ty1/copia-type domain-containing protein n=1 Tax=Tanacetum coccineum TaxID=301880 RepID=A0ABQ4WCB4_9ASTR
MNRGVHQLQHKWSIEKRSFPKYLKDLKDGKGVVTQHFTVLQGLKESRKLKHGELNLVMGNRKITHVTKIGKYELMLKSGLELTDDNISIGRRQAAMKDLEIAAYVLGIKIYRDRTRRLIGLSQDTYLDKILKRFKIENSKKGNLPLHHGIKISCDLCPKTDDELDKMSRVSYASVIGSIMYAMTCTRPDVSFALSMFLVYGGEKELRVTGYCDASWQTDKDDMADSTCESEYIAACEASKEAIWMKNFIGDLGVVPTVQDPIEIFCDNESAVALTKEPKDHRKSKHIDRKYHFVRSKVAEGHVIVKDVRSEDNSADPFTKALAKSKHDEHAWSI